MKKTLLLAALCVLPFCAQAQEKTERLDSVVVSASRAASTTPVTFTSVGKDQLQAMKDYLRDNPRRLFVRRAHPDYFTVTRSVLFRGKECDIVGNRALMGKPLHAVHVRSRFTPEERRNYMNDCIVAARQGKVLIGAFISDYEKQVRDEALQEGLPIIQLSSTPFSDFYKPYGHLFDACADGLVLMIHPVSLSSVPPSAYMPSSNPYWQTQRRISHAECVALNAIAQEIAG